jgi:hypothetical protein
LGNPVRSKQLESTIRGAVFKALDNSTVHHTVSKLATIIKNENISPVMITRLVIPTPEFENNIKTGLKSGIYTDEPIDFPDLRQAFTALEQTLSWEIAVTAGLETIVRPLLRSQVFSTKEFMRHAAATAAGCAVIAQQLDLPKHQFIVAGLFHNIGIPILVNSYPDDYDHFIELATGSNFLLEDLESQRFGFNHQDVGSLFLMACLFPDTCWKASASHHSSEMTSDLITASVRLCSNIAHQVGCTLGLANGCNSIHPNLISKMGISETAMSQMASRMASAAMKGAKYE